MVIISNKCVHYHINTLFIVRNLDMNKIIDMNGALEVLGGMAELFYKMLARYETASGLDANMVELGKGLEEMDSGKMKNGAHKIKGSSGYVGASRLHYATFCIHECWEANHDDYEGMIHYYQSVVEAVIEFKIYSRYFLAQHTSKMHFKSNILIES